MKRFFIFLMSAIFALGLVLPATASASTPVKASVESVSNAQSAIALGGSFRTRTGSLGVNCIKDWGPDWLGGKGGSGIGPGVRNGVWSYNVAGCANGVDTDGFYVPTTHRCDVYRMSSSKYIYLFHAGPGTYNKIGDLDQRFLYCQAK